MTSIPDYKSQDRKQLNQISVNAINSADLDYLHDSFLPKAHEEELIRVVLRRNRPGISTCFYGLRAEKQKNCELDGKVRKTYSTKTDEDEKQSSSVVERALRRAFSMRASSPSGNEVYRRIDHHYDPVPVGDHEENKFMLQTETESSDKKRNKVLEACRRFFGF